MNVFVRNIGKGELRPEPDETSKKLDIEDNIGESIHVHIRNLRLEFSVEDYLEFAAAINEADQRLEYGDR